ncbi:MAG: V-type ATP synthase subunit I [Eubacteriales bacterium]|nr:V-type ATP synthase subunit I [Eubacteriales bacterium]
MAIAEMKRIGLLMMRRDHDQLLKLAQRMGCVHVTDTDLPDDILPRKDAARAAELEAEIARYQWAIRKLNKYDPAKQSMFRPLPDASMDDLEQADQARAQNTIRAVEDLERQAGELRGRESRFRATLDQLAPWLQLDIPVEINRSTRTVRVFTGSASAKGLEGLAADWAGKPAVIKTLLPVKDSLYFWAAVHKGEAERFLQALQAIGYQPVSLPDGTGTPQSQHDKAEKALASLDGQYKSLEENLRKEAEHLPALRLGYEALKAELDREGAQIQMVHTASTSYLYGWVPAAAALGVEAAIKEQFPDTVVNISDPKEEDEPPVLLRNNRVVAPFESIVTGFSMPHPKSLDPTGIMMPFFACFFGMMVSDAGYGIMMALLVPLLIKLVKPSKEGRKLFWVIGIGGVFTVLWGAMYNTWFGFAPWPTLFDPVNDSLPVMILCMALGAVHMFTGLGVAAYLNIRRGQYLDVLCDQLSWFSLVVGLGMLMFPPTAGIGKWMAIGGAFIVLLTAGRDKGNNPIKRLLSGLGALYNVSGWLSDLLSYMRLFGMGLATGVIGMVINLLVGMVADAGFIGIIIAIPLFVGGHLFNAAINILGAYVHASRLQYIEFFGKFFEDGGIAFKPLGYSPRYVRVHDAS